MQPSPAATVTHDTRPVVTPRNLSFQIRSVQADRWMAGDPVATAVFNALSLTFPDGERMFMDAVRLQRDRLSGRLLEEANAFIAQEAIHSREHVGLNAALDPQRYPVARIAEIMGKRLAFLRRRGPIPMLGVTIALEHFTAMMADLFLRDPTFWSGTSPEMARLWQWHAMEETEHKAVAFDVFNEVTKTWGSFRRYRLRVQAMLATTLFFNLNIVRYASMLLAADGMGRWAAVIRVVRYLYGRNGLLRTCGGAYRDWYRPGFHPWDHDNRALLEAWRPLFASSTAA